MEYVNLTPHAIVVCNSAGEVVRTFPASGKVARVETRSVFCDMAEGIEHMSQEYGEVQGLPAYEPGVRYIVSGLVRSAVLGRHDVVSPGELVRNSAGQPVGCKGFIMNSWK